MPRIYFTLFDRLLLSTILDTAITDYTQYPVIPLCFRSPSAALTHFALGNKRALRQKISRESKDSHIRILAELGKRGGAEGREGKVGRQAGRDGKVTRQGGDGGEGRKGKEARRGGREAREKEQGHVEERTSGYIRLEVPAFLTIRPLLCPRLRRLSRQQDGEFDGGDERVVGFGLIYSSIHLIMKLLFK